MALIVAPAAGAESYISVADATAYHAARGNAAWAALPDDTAREQKLRIATDFMGQLYGSRWKGSRVSAAQTLDWPRYGVCSNGFPVDSTIVPVAVANACAELALRAIDGDLAPDLGAQVKQETVGPISVTYADGARQQVAYQSVDGMLRPYLSGSANQIKLVRG